VIWKLARDTFLAKALTVVTVGKEKNGEITVIYQRQSNYLKCWPATKAFDLSFGQKMLCSMGGLYQQDYSATSNITLYAQVICKGCYIHISFN
jgi:hypothetical protein